MVKKVVTKKKGLSVGKAVAIGAGVAAVSAGAYYFLGPNGKKNQQKAKAWMAEMKKEAVKKIGKVERATKPAYDKAVDALASAYSKQYKAHAPEIKAFANTLKKEWQTASAKAKPVVVKAKKEVKKIVKKVEKKVAPKGKKK